MMEYDKCHSIPDVYCTCSGSVLSSVRLKTRITKSSVKAAKGTIGKQVQKTPEEKTESKTPDISEATGITGHKCEYTARNKNHTKIEPQTAKCVIAVQEVVSNKALPGDMKSNGEEKGNRGD